MKYILLLLLAGTCWAVEPPMASFSKAAEMPDFWQLDSRGQFSYQGLNFCCPVAVSNALVYFAGHGYKNLLPDSEQPPIQAQIDLIKLLASPDYFCTNPKTGTMPEGLMRGLHRYVEEKGYVCQRLEYAGWRPVGITQQSAVIAPLPQLDWMRQAISDSNGAVWLNIGWYVQGKTANEWDRICGHWVTLVGYGGRDSADPNVFLIHNSLVDREAGHPAKKPDLPDYAVTLTPLPADGSIIVDGGEKRSTQGMYRVSGPGLPTKRGRFAFLDAAIVFVIGDDGKSR